MKCLTRYEMKFGNLVVPARTKCTIIGPDENYPVNAAGIILNIIVYNYDLGIENIENENNFILYQKNSGRDFLKGLVISTNTESVYMYADTYMDRNYKLFDWQVKRILHVENIPKELAINGIDCIKLSSVIEYLEEEFNVWIMENCEFITLDESNIEEYSFMELPIGYSVLSDKGMKKFIDKQLEYRKKLERIGFTYEFTGNLYIN